MEDEIRRLRMENEFLKKAAAFFARTHPEPSGAR
jgi:transposase